ncbi:PilN domain-containing protein [Candidatus Berkelbacteria bacterium]|nr:PilN domain-containing protein [Candidatus Berkelbacteria bacterium]
MIDIQLGNQSSEQPVERGGYGASPHTTDHQAQPGITTIDGGSSDRVILAVTVTAVVLVALTGVVVSFLDARSRAEAQKLDSEVSALAAQLETGSVADAFHRAQTVARQIQILGSFQAQATAWPAVLDALTAVIPKSSQVTNLTFGADQTLRVEGEATNGEEVARFMAALDASDRFDPPTLSSLSLNETVDGSATLFSLQTTYESHPIQIETETTGGGSNDH